MPLHKPFDRHFFTVGGSVMKQGGSLNLNKGEIGLFNMDKTTRQGASAVSDLAQISKKTKLELRMGRGDAPMSRSGNVKNFSSFPFQLKDVKKVAVNGPKKDHATVDELIIGYNGIDNNTTLMFEKGDRYKLNVRLSGEAIGFLGYPRATVDIPLFIDAEHCSPYAKLCEACDPCDNLNCIPIIEDTIERLKNFPLRGGTKVSEFVDITPIIKCNGIAPELDTIPHTFYKLMVCDSGDANALSSVRVQIPELALERVNYDGATSTYKALVPEGTELPESFKFEISSLKDCEACLEMQDEIEGGFWYVLNYNDQGEDETSAVSALFDNPIEVVKQASSNFVGVYTVLLEKEFDGDLTAETKVENFDFVGNTKALCEYEYEVPVVWVEAETCYAIEKEYIIDVPDDECGVARLEDLQAFYPELVIEEEGTTGGCQTRYKTKTVTELVCDECDDVFKDFYRSNVPEDFEGRKWKEVVAENGAEGCRCGIRIKGKPFVINPDDCLIDKVGFVNSSTRVEAGGGYITEVRYGEVQTDKPFHTEYLSKATDVTYLGGNLKDLENRSFRFFTGSQRAYDKVTQALKGESSNIDNNSQYVDYVVTIKRSPYFSQSFSGQEDETINYHIMAPLGMHADVEALVNMIAGGAGVEPVRY